MGYGLRSINKSCSSLLVFAFSILYASVSSAQLLPIPSGFGLNFGAVKITPFAQVGYKKFGLNLNLPLTNDEGAFFATPPALDLNLRDARAWIGSVGFDARIPAGLFLTLRAEGSASKNIDVITGQNVPIAFQPTPYTWSGSNFQWWDVDGLVGFNFLRDWALVVGLRYDKLTVGMRNPINAEGTPVTTFFPAEIFRFEGDLLVKTWIPYFGLQLNTPTYRASFLYSPWASPDVIVPEQAFSLISIFPGVGNESSGWEWKFSHRGNFFEAFAEYDFPLFDRLKLGLWVKGSWMGFTGTGTWDFNDRTLFTIFGIPVFDIVTTFNQSVDSSLYRYEFAGGLTAFCDF